MFKEMSFKGVTRCLVDDHVDTNKLRFHISELDAGARPHPLHTHPGVEVFYVLEGNGTLEVESERHSLGPNESIMLDSSRPHCLVNTGNSRMRYLVVMAPSSI